MRLLVKMGKGDKRNANDKSFGIVLFKVYRTQLDITTPSDVGLSPPKPQKYSMLCFAESLGVSMSPPLGWSSNCLFCEATPSCVAKSCCPTFCWRLAITHFNKKASVVYPLLHCISSFCTHPLVPIRFSDSPPAGHIIPHPTSSFQSIWLCVEQNKTAKKLAQYTASKKNVNEPIHTDHAFSRRSSL